MTDALDRYYTPDALARAIVEALPVESPASIYEPCVGGGAFVRAARERWRGVPIIGADVDPDAEGLALCDVGHRASCLSVPVSADLVITNPPFTTGNAEARDRAFAVTMRAIASGTRVALLLPAAWLLGGAAYGWLRSPGWRPCSVRAVVGRPWSGVREMAVYYWCPARGHQTTIGRSIEWGRPRPSGTESAPEQVSMW